MKANTGAQCGCEMGEDCSKITVCTGHQWVRDAVDETDQHWIKALQGILDDNYLDNIYVAMAVKRASQ